MKTESNVNKLLKERQQSWFYGEVKEQAGTPPMLVLKHRNGNESAYGYHFLSKCINYNPSEGIKLRFIDSEGVNSILIEGRNLTKLWETLTRHRVTFIRELENNFSEPEDDTLCVININLTNQ